MFYQFAGYIIITWFVSQSLKLILKRGQYKLTKKHVLKTYFLYSGPPSSHAAILAITLLYIRNIYSLHDPIFLITSIFAVLWLYEIYMQRKRYNHLSYLISTEHNKHHIKYQKEFHGHAIIDILTGIGVGSFVFNLLQFINI